ncbi:hypothetical protein, partial [Nonomuraea sp. NPDC049784]|uniref:hypothetical protein n=1 Tax=Nonomuraea sp. NPDC049784 TaxID=3154361 RepID=UPI0033D5DB06
AAELAQLLTAVGQVPPPPHLPVDGGLAFLDEAALGFVMLHRDDADLAAAHHRFSTARLALHRTQDDRAKRQGWQETATAAAHLADLLTAFGDERVGRCTRQTVEGWECSSPLDPVTGRCAMPRATYGFWFNVTSAPHRFDGEDTITATVARRARAGDPVCRWIADDPAALAWVADSYAAAIRAVLPVGVEMHPARSDRDPPIGEEFIGPAHLDDCSWPATYPRTPAGGLDLPTLLSRIDLGQLLVRAPRPADPDD